MGATVNEITLIDILCEAGKQISKGEKIAELESDKSIFDFEAPCEGVIRRIFCRAGDILPVGSPFLRIETEDSSLSHLEATEDEPVVETPTASVAVADQIEPEAKSEPVLEKTLPAPSAAKQGIRWTPRARKMALERNLDPDHLEGVTGTGPGGRVTGDDFHAFLGSVQSTELASVPAPSIGDSDTKTVCVAGIGYAIPKNARSNADILKQFPGKTEEEIVKVTGIQQRYVISEGESATSLASQATKHGLLMANLRVR